MTQTERKRLAKVYRDAAGLIESGRTRFCCYAIACVLGHEHWDSFEAENEPARIRFVDEFSDGYEWTLQRRIDSDNGDEARNHRIVLLCLMSAMVEAGDA